MVLTNKQKIGICKFWEENPQTIGADITLGNIDEDDLDLFIDIISGENGKLTLKKIEDYRRKIESEEREKESHEMQKKELSYKKAIILILITAFVSNIDRIVKFIINLFKSV